MFGLQPLHWLVIAVIALLFFAPQRLPQLGRAIGKTIVELKEAGRELKRGAQDSPDSAEPQNPSSSQTK
jgi:sec-independent protein translocase protein TatA